MFNIYYKVTHYTTLTSQFHKLDTWPLECVQAMMSLNLDVLTRKLRVFKLAPWIKTRRMVPAGCIRRLIYSQHLKIGNFIFYVCFREFFMKRISELKRISSQQEVSWCVQIRSQMRGYLKRILRASVSIGSQQLLSNQQFQHSKF